MTKQKIFALLRTVAFLMAALLLFVLFSALGAAYNNVGQKYYAVYSTPDGEDLDVAFFGASHCTDAFLPLNLYEDTGLTSYNFGSQGQSMENVYWTMKEVLERQNPKVVVVEAFLLSWPYNWTGDTGSLFWTGGVRTEISDFSPNKVLAAKSISKVYSAADELYRFPTFRYDWNKWTRNDLISMKKNTVANLTFGSAINYETWDIENNPWVDYDTGSSPEIVEINADILSVMQRIAELAKQHDVPLVFAVAPYKTIDSEDYCYAKIEQWCNENGVYFWNGLDIAAEQGWDYSANQFDRGHQNYTGGTLTTAWFGEYLTQTFGLTANRSDEWDSYLTRYHQYLQEHDLSTAATLDEFLEKASDLSDGYALLVSADNGAIDSLTEEQIERIQNLGFTDFAAFSRYVGFVGDGQLWQDSTADTIDVLFNGSSFRLTDADSIDDDTDSGQIMLEQVTVTNAGHFRLAVYSKEQAAIVAVFAQ